MAGRSGGFGGRIVGSAFGESDWGDRVVHHDVAKDANLEGMLLLH